MSRRRTRTNRVANWAAAALFLLALGCSSDASSPPSSQTLHSLIAVGDTGRTTTLGALFEGQISVAKGMAVEHAREAVDDLLLLGDNFYWSGLSHADLEERLRINVAFPYCPFVRLDGPRSAALRSACENPGGQDVRIFAVLGNHDLRGEESVFLQREVVPDFVANWKMAREMVEVVELGDGISLILFESELMLTQELALDALTAAVAAAPGPWRIVAAHRPIGMGERGEPVAGGFPALVLNAIRAASVPVQLYLAGHEHNLQLLKGDPGGPFLTAIAGSGSRASTELGPPLPATLFAAQELGFLRVDLIRSGTPAQERLMISFFRSPRFPVLAWGAPKRLARWSVGEAGDLREESR